MGAQDTLIKHLESQGATVKKTKKGIMIYGPPPTKGTFTIHNTPSDHRSLANDMAALRRIGLTHPLDKKPLTLGVGEGYGPHILDPITERIEKRARQLLHEAGWPTEVTTKVLTGHMAGATAEKALYHLGYRHDPDGRRQGQARVWVGDEEIARLHEEVMAHRQPAVEPDVEVKLREDAFDHGTPPTPEVTLRTEECDHTAWEDLGGGARRCADCKTPLPPHEFHCGICGSNTHDGIGHPFVDDHQGEELERIDYIDERDSWVVELQELLPPSIFTLVENQLRPLRAVGIEYELRVWRKR